MYQSSCWVNIPIIESLVAPFETLELVRFDMIAKVLQNKIPCVFVKRQQECNLRAVVAKESLFRQVRVCSHSLGLVDFGLRLTP